MHWRCMRFEHTVSRPGLAYRWTVPLLTFKQFPKKLLKKHKYEKCWFFAVFEYMANINLKRVAVKFPFYCLRVSGEIF